MDIMKMVTGAITPMIAAKVAGAFGVPEAAVRKLMAVGVPVVLATLMKRGATAGGTDAIGAALGGLGKSPLEGLGAALGGDASSITTAAQGGSDMLGSLLGVGPAGGLARTLASYAGIDEKAAGPLLGLAGSAALGGLKSAADTQGLDAAGVMRLLGTQRNQIETAIPADLGRMLSTSGLLPQAADLSGSARSAVQAAAAPADSGGWVKWVVGAIALGALAWLVSPWFAGDKDEAVTEAPAAETTAADAGDALVVDGVNVGESVQGILTTITDTLAGVTDAGTATAAVQALTDADTALGGLETAVGALTGDGKSALQGLIGGALPALRTTVEGLLGDSAIGPILKPVLDSILARLTAFGS